MALSRTPSVIICQYFTYAIIGCGMVLTGCAPSLRYTSGEAVITSDKYLVPKNWDYRSSYQVPVARLNSVIASYMGTRYRLGGMSRKGVDCSGFVCLVFREVNHAKLGRSTGKMRKYGRMISRNDARAGDLVFFRGGIFNTINHVGIYLGEGRFAHASTSQGVIYSSLDETYYKEHFAEIRRIF